MDHRLNAKSHVDAIVAQLRGHGARDVQPLIEECEALSQAIAAFHMEGIRFRMFNVDRMLLHHLDLPAEIARGVADARRELEAAGFHTRSHQAPS
jgi:hypothetical protein